MKPGTPGLPGDEPEGEAMTQRLRIARKCPRCKRRLYHWSTLTGRKVETQCADCGHQWRPRYVVDEWERSPK